MTSTAGTIAPQVPGILCVPHKSRATTSITRPATAGAVERKADASEVPRGAWLGTATPRSMALIVPFSNRPRAPANRGPLRRRPPAQERAEN